MWWVFGVLSTALSLEGQNLTHDSGTATYTQNFRNGSIISILDGDATFTGTLRNNTTVNVSGGSALFSGDLLNNVVFNISGGITTINSVKNNATFNVTGGELKLNQPIGNNASLDIDSGTLSLGTDDVFANNTNITLTDATLDTGGNHVSFDSLTLNGDSTLDLGDNPEAIIDAGTISGDGTLTVTGFSESTQLQFDEGSSTIEVGDQIMFGDFPGTIGDNGAIIPAVPEPSTILGGVILGACMLGFEIRRRRSRS